MADSLRLIPLGGFGEIGKNMSLLDCNGELLLIDAGIAFPDEESQLGADLLIPDYSYLREQAHRVVGVMLTHGHEDHIGGLPYVLRELDVPVYGTPLTLGLVRAKLSQHQVELPDLRTVRRGDRITVGSVFDIECIRVNHSIPDCLALGIRTPAGIVVHSGDFKFDHTPIDGDFTDFSALARLGDEGVKLLISDSTNIERPGHTPSEMAVGDAFDRLFPTCEGRILVASFASQIHRIQQVFDVAAAHGRKVMVAGRSMERNVNVARELGYLHYDDEVRIGATDLNHLPESQVVILITGTQGEPVSGLTRLSRGSHPKLRLHPTDTVILSATPIPGNEATVWRLINDLLRGGARVVDHREATVHVSGHASREEIALLFNLIRPEYAVPFHGEYRHMIAYGELAQEVGLSHDRVFLLHNGDVLRLDDDGAKLEESIAHGVWSIDGRRVNEQGRADDVAQDRGFLAESGVIAGSVCWDFATGEMVGRPQVGVRGVRPGDEGLAALIEGAVAAVVARLDQLEGAARLERVEVERAVKRSLRSYFERTTRTYPVLQALVIGAPGEQAAAPAVELDPDEPAAVARQREPVLVVDGEVGEVLHLTREALATLARPEDDPDDLAAVPLRSLLEAAAATATATHLVVANELEGYSASLPLSAVADRGRLVYGVADQPLDSDEGGPLRFLIRDAAECGLDELDTCANVKGVNRLTLTVGPGVDSGPVRRDRGCAGTH